MSRILVNHVYYSPVGHVVEAIRYARGFHDANPGSEVHVALSDGAPWELCAGAPWITEAYRIPVAAPGSCDLSFPEMPREWDYIVDNNLMALEDENSDLSSAPTSISRRPGAGKRRRRSPTTPGPMPSSPPGRAAACCSRT